MLTLNNLATILMMNKQIRIFLADDDEDDCLLFRDALNEINPEYELVTAKDGVEIIEALVDKIPPQPLCLFLDINMPRKNGLDCLKEIRNSESETLNQIPIVMFSTSMDENYIDRAHLYGANYYMRKPSTFACLINGIEKVISLPMAVDQKTPIGKFVVLPDSSS